MVIGHNSDYNLSFYNDRVKEIIDASIVAEPFTYVPIIAGHMELVGGNALVFGKITEGYDVIDIDISTEITYQDISLENPIIALAVTFVQIGTTSIVFTAPYYDDAKTYYEGDIVEWADYYYRCKTTTQGNSPIPHRRDETVNDPYWSLLTSSQSPSFRSIAAEAVITIPSPIAKEGSTYTVSVINGQEGINNTASSVVAPGDTTVAQVVAGLVLDIIAKGFDYEGSSSSGGKIFIYRRLKLFLETPERETGDFNNVHANFTFSASIINIEYNIILPQLKCGATHGFGIVYKDRSGRICSVIKNANMDVYLPFYTEKAESLIEAIANLTFNIYNKPPEWAESYEIVYFGNISMDYFLQIRANNIYEITLYGANRHRYSINISDTITNIQTQNNRWKVPNYSWVEGDRLRLVGTIDNNTGKVSKYTIPLYYGSAIGADFVYDYEIESTGTQYGDIIGGDWLICQAIEHPTPFVGETNILVEIYRPRKGLGITTPYGTGMVFDIGIDANGYKYHKGDVDQILDINEACVTPAEVNNFTTDKYSKASDCWKFLRLNYRQIGDIQTGVIYPFWAESIFPSDWWKDQIISNKLTSQGFPFLDDLSQRQTVLDERIRHGGFLITGTRTNNIAHFTYDDFMDLPKKNGDITGLREVGFTLKVIQMYKETSIYINRIQTFNPDGTEQFTLTDKFLAEQRPMETDYGCQHPDSVTVNGRNLYYWDNSQGAFIRSAPNGQISLSGADYKMSRWFKDLSKWIHSDGSRSSLVVNIGANNDFEEVWIMFRIGSTVKGIIFSEKKGRYISEIDQITESYLHLGNFFAHLYNQKLWIMNIDEGQDFLSWAGTDTEAEFEVVSNMEPSKNKVFNAIAVIADHLLESVTKSTYIPEEASAVNEIMETNIPIFDRREGIYYGKIMRDENSKGVFASTISKKLNGREMRGRYCFVKLTTDEHTEKVRVDSVVIFSTLSERNI
jgi:hypothetical protein